MGKALSQRYIGHIVSECVAVSCTGNDIWQLSEVVYHASGAALLQFIACSVAVGYATGVCSGMASHRDVECSVAHHYGACGVLRIMLLVSAIVPSKSRITVFIMIYVVLYK